MTSLRQQAVTNKEATTVVVGRGSIACSIVVDTRFHLELPEEAATAIAGLVSEQFCFTVAAAIACQCWMAALVFAATALSYSTTTAAATRPEEPVGNYLELLVHLVTRTKSIACQKGRVEVTSSGIEWAI